MTNFEFYKDKILDIVKNGNEIAIVNNKIVECKNIECKNDELCSDKRSTKGVKNTSDCIKWLYEEYKEPITPTITQKEKALLEIINYDFFIRNHLGEIHATSKEPKIYSGKAVIDGDADSINLSKAFDVSLDFITWKTDKIWTRQELLSLEVRDNEENNNESKFFDQMEAYANIRKRASELWSYQQTEEDVLEDATTMTLDEAIEHCLEKSDCTSCGKEHLQLANWLKELSEVKSLTEQNLLFRLPCKVGDKLYVLVEPTAIKQECVRYKVFSIVEYIVDSFILTDTTIVKAHTDNVAIGSVDVHIYLDEFGKTVFKTVEDAQEALAKRAKIVKMKG